jgi:hypothetical protein
MSCKEILVNPMTKAVHLEEQKKLMFEVIGHRLKGKQGDEMKELEKLCDDAADDPLVAEGVVERH